MIELKKNMTILFQGDSITDFYRELDYSFGIGVGYARDVVANVLINHPELNIKFINKGIGGNRTKDLVARWDEDCINLKPDICTILIGINDTWRRYDENDPTSLEEFIGNYKNILDKCKANNIKCLLIEPFVFPSNADWKKWLDEDLTDKQKAVKELAKEYYLDFIPMHSIFMEACKKYEPQYLSSDGVHPNIPGHVILANEILKVFGVK